MKQFFTYLFLVVAIAVHAQEKVADTIAEVDSTVTISADSSIADTNDLPPLPPGKLRVYQDSYYGAVKELQKKINKENCPKLVKGYRVQVFSCSGEECKEKANKYYNQFLIAYPKYPVYKMWQVPSIKVRAGDCRTRFEAEKIKKEIEKDFPFVFIVPDYIESPYKINCEDMKLASDSL